MVKLVRLPVEGEIEPVVERVARVPREVVERLASAEQLGWPVSSVRQDWQVWPAWQVRWVQQELVGSLGLAGCWGRAEP